MSSDFFYDGAPVQAGLSSSGLSGQSPHFSLVGIREMLVIDTRYVDDTDPQSLASSNQTRSVVEYSCRDLMTGEVIHGVRRLTTRGGIDAGDEEVLHHANNLLPDAKQSPAFSKASAARDVDGDRVLVGFIEGSLHRGVILGSLHHPKAAYGAKRSDGERRYTLHKGTSIVIDKEGNYTIEHKTGATLRFLEDGSIEAIPAGGKDIRLGSEILAPVLDGVVTGRGVDAFTGTPYSALGNSSVNILAKK